MKPLWYWTLSLLWASALLVVALALPLNGRWTIDDGVKRIAATCGEGEWAERLDDGPIRARLSDPAAHAPLHVPFAYRGDGALVFGFSPLTRAVFKGYWGAPPPWSRLLPALIVIAIWLLFEVAGIRWSFLLLPLTFYGLVPWEHALSWLLLWPAVWTTCVAVRSADKQAFRLTRPLIYVAAGGLLGVAILLRPETLLLLVVLIPYLLFKRGWKPTLALAAGAALCGVAFFIWHGATSNESPFEHLRLNLTYLQYPHAATGWLDRLEGIYALLIRMDYQPLNSAILIALFLGGATFLWQAERRNRPRLIVPSLMLFGAWLVIYQYRLWSSSLPPIAVMGANSLLAALPWTFALFLPSYRGQRGFLLGGIAMLLAIVASPIWDGVHWGPRLLLFAVPLWAISFSSSKNEGKRWLRTALLVLTAIQSTSSAVLVYARAQEVSDRVKLSAARLGTPVICPTMSQCVDLAALWPQREFFTAANPRELRQLLIELRHVPVDTVWLHEEAEDSLYAAAFPTGKPVWPHRVTLLPAGTLYQTRWRLLELVMNREDSLWAGVLEQEAGELMAAGKPEAALPLQQEAVRVAPGGGKYHHNLAVLLAQMGRRDEAIIEAETALALNPDLKESVQLLEFLARPPAIVP